MPCRGTAVLCPSSRRLSPVPAGEVRRVPPLQNPFVTGFPGGASSSLPRSAGQGSLQASPLARKLLPDKSCVHPLVGNRQRIHG